MKTPKILLILEEPRDLQVYGTALVSLGYEVALWRDCDEGIHSLEKEKADLLIVSQGAHSADGRSVLEHALQLHPRVPVLVLARTTDAHCFFEAMDFGAADYLERPLPSDLLWAVETQLRRYAEA